MFLGSDAKEQTSVYTLKFLPRGDKTSTEHPTGTRCGPDIAVVRQYSGMPKAEELKLHRYHIEGTGRRSSGKSEAKSDAQAASYTALNLQARPDLCLAIGICLENQLQFLRLQRMQSVLDRPHSLDRRRHSPSPSLRLDVTPLHT